MSDNRGPESLDVQYILLVRHGHRQKAYDGTRLNAALLNKSDAPLDNLKSVDEADDGWPTAKALSFWTAESLQSLGLTVVDARCSPAQDAKETAKAYLETFRLQGLTTLEELPADDGILVKVSPNESLCRDSLLQPLKDLHIQPDSQGDGRNKVLVICGHQPQLTHIANAWLGSWFWRRRPSLPLREGEAALLQLSPTPALRWAVTKADEHALETLRQKISSKVDLAKVFAASTGVVIGLLLQADQPEVQKENWCYWLGLGVLLWSLVWSLFALCAYDRLSMPRMFWTRRSHGSRHLVPTWLRRLLPGWDLERPPSREHLVLFSGMVRTWVAFFIPAFITLVFGLELLLLHSLRGHPVISILTLVILAFSLVWYFRGQPDLGPQD